MPRTVRNAKIDTRSARSKLAQRREPYWTSIQPGCALGYRKGTKGGTWIARFYAAGAASPMRYRALGPADDTLDADPDGVVCLSFAQAQGAARDWLTEQARVAAGFPATAAGPYTVADAVRDYLAWYGRHRKALQDTTVAANAHIVPTLGDIEIGRLTTARLREWHEELAAAPARRRTRPGKPQAVRKAASDPDAARKRRATANRVLTVLKAALNHAYREHKVASDDAWRRVKPFRDVDAPVVRYLTEAECVRLVNVADPDFRPMVRAALLTGCRYGELAALRVSDFNPDAGTIAVRTSKSGKPRHVVLTDEGRAFFAEAAAGKEAGAPILARPDGERWGRNHQQRPLTEACELAKISPAVSFHVLRHTHGSLLAMRGVPLAVIARQLGHADTRMTERHYAHLAPSYVADTIRGNFPTLGIVAKSPIVAFKPRIAGEG
ncbi:MAG: tyrosine-type recombinase/integrase [Rhizobiaceae bacterium]